MLKSTIINSPQELADKMNTLKPNQHMIVKGVTGSAKSGGVFFEEYLSELTGNIGYRTFDKMARQDYQIRMVEKLYKLPLKGAEMEWSVPAVPNGEVIRDLIKWQFEEGFNKSANDVKNDILSYMRFGFSLFEPLISVQEHPKFGTINYIEDLGYRSQKTIYNWYTNRGQIDTVHQQVFGDTSGSYVMEGFDKATGMQKLWVIANERVGDVVEGESIFRSVYGNYWRKQLYLFLLGSGLEKSSFGIILVTVPPNKIGAPETDEFLASVRDYVAHEEAYLQKTKDFEVEVIDLPFDAQKTISAITFEDTGIAKNGLCQFTELGQNGNSGAKSLGVGLIDFFLSALKDHAKNVEDFYNSLAKHLTILNYGEQEEYPKLTLSGIEQLAFSELANALAMFTSAGVIKVFSEEDEDYIRKMVKMPKRVEGIEVEKPAPVDGDIEDALDEESDNEEGDGDNETNEEEQELSLRPNLLKAMRKDYDKHTATYNLSVMAKLTMMEAKFLRDLESVLKQKPRNVESAISNIPIGFVKQLEDVILTSLNDSVMTGRKQGQVLLKNYKRLATSKSLTPKIRGWISGTAKITAKSIAAEFEKKAKLAATTAAQNVADSSAEYSRVAFNTGKTTTSFKANINNLGAGIVVNRAIAKGRDAYIEEVTEAGITGWEYVAVLDDKTTDLCLWLDGRTAQNGDPDVATYSPPNHHNCRSFKLPIMSDMEQPEEWDGWNVPASYLGDKTLSGMDAILYKSLVEVA